MILGKIIGRTSTRKFSFKIEKSAEKFQYVQVMHKDIGYILAQIDEIERDSYEIAHCSIIGYKKENRILLPRSPLTQETEVLDADTAFLKEILEIKQKSGAYIGKLENKDIKIYLDLNKLLTKHIAIMAKTGAGKSYTSGILLEEIIEKKVPLLIIDPHGEYSDMSHPNDNKDDIKLLEKEGMKPKGYKEAIIEYGDPVINENFKPLALNDELTPQELLNILPAKLTERQKAMLYSTAKELETLTLNTLTARLAEDNDISNINLVSVLDYLKSLKIFTPDYIPYHELIKPGVCSIINMKGIPPDIQQIIVYKLLKDLFEERKLGRIAPFFTVIEEAHNFAPERSFGETKSSSIIRTLASEGRKFGLGLCVLSQRPARLDKNVLSQCSTQIILKVTNPHDLKAISSSVENITQSAEDEIKNLAIGSALVTGVLDIPLLIRIRPRRSKHGGTTVNILDESKGLLNDLSGFSKKEMLPVILPRTSPKDLMLGEGKEKLSAILIPCVLAPLKSKRDSSFLIERIKGHIVTNIDTKETLNIPKVNSLSKSQNEFLIQTLELGNFSLDKINEKSKIPILKLKENLDFLMKFGTLEKNTDKYQLTKMGILLKNPSGFLFRGSCQYMQIAYSSKLRPRISIEGIKNMLSFFDVKELRECYLVYYKVE